MNGRSVYPNLTDVIEKGLRAEQREPTGKLHCSSHSWKPLRFTQLEQIFQTEENDFGSLMTLSTGTMYHAAVEKWLEDYLGDEWSVETEIDLTGDLPRGWTGTADYLFYHKPTKTFVVGDLKTTKPEGIQYLGSEPKSEHRIQVSCYHAALSADDRPLDPEIFIYYLPKGRDSRGNTVMPKTLTTKAMSKAAVWTRLNGIKEAVDAYLVQYDLTGEVDNNMLAPMPDPELKLYWDRAKMQWDVKSVPFWYNSYCGLPEEFVPKQSTNLVGKWSLDGVYWPRKGYEYITENDVPKPDHAEMRKRQNA